MGWRRRAAAAGVCAGKQQPEPELRAVLFDTRGVEARMLDVAQTVERAADVAALTEAVMELGAEDQAVVTAWLADSRGRGAAFAALGEAAGDGRIGSVG